MLAQIRKLFHRVVNRPATPPAPPPAAGAGRAGFAARRPATPGYVVAAVIPDDGDPAFPDLISASIKEGHVADLATARAMAWGFAVQPAANRIEQFHEVWVTDHAGNVVHRVSIQHDHTLQPA